MRTAVSAAASDPRINVKPYALQEQVDRGVIAPDWALWVRPDEPEGNTEELPGTLQALRDQVSRLTKENKELARAANQAHMVRHDVLNLASDPPIPPGVPLPKRGGKHEREAVILHLSDQHWGEVVRLETMAGMNSYNMEIARKRLAQCFSAVIDLITDHWSGPPPCSVVVILGGDSISGDIHAELQKTNELQSIPALRDCASEHARCLKELADAAPCPVQVYCVPGNHGRTTLKPESKLYVETNYDTLLADFLEWHFREVGDDRIEFFRPDSGDALFKVFGWQFFVTHGDRIGAKGGQGFIGPAASIARGMKKIVDEYSAQRIFIDWILMGHFHTPLMLEHGFANGCLPGPSEYSRDIRARPKPATQNFFQVHPERGITCYRQIQLGHPDEGSIYERPVERTNNT